ncbi:MAG: iron-sulfur cluster-binding domain-containing protein [Lachnospiraceae bacterium]|nr:iron-sulfur cluster-binding domain-containing protein [Lachnospiraceae bacterium]
MRYTLEGLPNHEKIMAEIDTCKMYNIDHRGNRGKIESTIEKIHPKRIEYLVDEIRQEGRTAKTIRLVPKNGYVPPFVPGQYISIEAELGGIKTARAYSLSSGAAQRAYYEITVRRTRDGFVSDYLLDELKPGDTVFSSGPAGNFVQFPAVHGKNLVFIAGGSGITPFMSMLRTDEQKLVRDKNVHLIYGCSREDDILFLEELKRLEKKGILQLHIIISEPEENCSYQKGMITEDAIRDIVGEDLEQYTFFLCGPSAMYDFVVPNLRNLGVPRRCIRQEVQTMPRNPESLAGWPEGIGSQNVFTVKTTDGRSFEAKATEMVLQAMERNGIVVPTLCRSGECSACRTKLVDGTVFHPGSELLRKSDMKFGYMHPCVTYPISNLVIRL